MRRAIRGTFVISPESQRRALIEKAGRNFSEVFDMDILTLCLVVQFCLAFGVAGLFWPEKIRPLFDVLMFPWAASHRSVRANSIAAIGLSILLIARLITVVR